MLNESLIQQKVRDLLSFYDLEFLINVDWGSNNSQGRELLAKAICEKAPQSRSSYSISHCPIAGGVLFSSHPVGLDIEVTQRVKWAPVRRISTDLEALEAPSPDALWCAKEAAFKALKTFSQPSVISPISIGKWQKIDSQTEKFFMLNPEAFKAPNDNKGVIIREQNLTLSFFIFHP